MNRERILLVDDNPDDIELTQRVLRNQPAAPSILTAQNGVEALALLHAPGADPRNLPSLVILDLNMPCMNGLETLHAIRTDARTRHLPVVIMTTSREERDITASYDGGANSYVQKPLDFEEFKETVRMLGHYWITLNIPRKNA